MTVGVLFVVFFSTRGFVREVFILKCYIQFRFCPLEVLSGGIVLSTRVLSAEVYVPLGFCPPGFSSTWSVVHWLFCSLGVLSTMGFVYCEFCPLVFCPLGVLSTEVSVHWGFCPLWILSMGFCPWGFC